MDCKIDKKLYYRLTWLTSPGKTISLPGKRMHRGPQKANSLAIAGFLVPFAAAGITGALILWFGEEVISCWASMVYVTVVPLILLTGLVLSLKSIPLIEKRGDRDYAYSGLTLNVLFLIVFILSVIYFL